MLKITTLLHYYYIQLYSIKTLLTKTSNILTGKFLFNYTILINSFTFIKNYFISLNYMFTFLFKNLYNT